MERISYEIEDTDGTVTETESEDVAQEAFLDGFTVTKVRTVTTYTEHTKIVLIAYESKTTF